ncbi:hypothetical protein DL768_010705 [Monosporascus sp. mg162]|nr:hypothetical protein DL768_010705 [Monosporascus sp. mg162]
MASYHRVLDVFDRSVGARSLECNCDIDPWDILIDEERWTGKIRLIGFVDVFFLICYSGKERFEKGIIIYKDNDSVRSTLERAGKNTAEYVVNQEALENENIQKSYYSFEDDKGGLSYQILGLGHPVGLNTNYDPGSLKQYKIKIRRSTNLVSRKPIERGLKQHSLGDLMIDVVRLGFLTQAELISKVVTMAVAGTATDDLARKYLQVLSGGQPGTPGLSRDRIRIAPSSPTAPRSRSSGARSGATGDRSRGAPQRHCRSRPPRSQHRQRQIKHRHPRPRTRYTLTHIHTTIYHQERVGTAPGIGPGAGAADIEPSTITVLSSPAAAPRSQPAVFEFRGFDFFAKPRLCNGYRSASRGCASTPYTERLPLIGTYMFRD